jgi:hypothetical protein
MHDHSSSIHLNDQISEAKDGRETGIHIPEPSVHEPSPFEVEIATAKLK